MSVNYELNQKTKDLVEKQINELISKGCLTPTENKTLEEAYKILVSIETLEQMGGQRQGNNGFSYGNEPPYGSYNSNGSYGYPNEIAQRHMFDGRVMSPNGTWNNNSYNDTMRRSSHSAVDKMIASLEKSMGDATSEYEKQEIQEEIHRLRMRETM